MQVELEEVVLFEEYMWWYLKITLGWLISHPLPHIDYMPKVGLGIRPCLPKPDESNLVLVGLGSRFFVPIIKCAVLGLKMLGLFSPKGPNNYIFISIHYNILKFWHLEIFLFIM